ncbi:hypothetical protein Rsub_05114 [Raphidocelis subcapitata]|uniref:2-oxoadipate dioxygenase/decarboxylase n=1 Tax=Raphidocelis subcapitata TaxID=307507 RepID=A0A2V0P6M9_9CHLO|nr:hypothetical protein Rsub_05114 [Raphidocelis subcapitata]|eukprot:GBF92745.1 hypothetical protein Rsub_05114 [Raphidocelis subcapitata]
MQGLAGRLGRPCGARAAALRARPRAPPRRRTLSAQAAPDERPATQPASLDAADLKGPARVFAASLRIILDRYWAATPSARRVVECLYSGPGGYGAAQVAHDHLAFRTLGVPGLGIDSIGRALEAFGYRRQDNSVFPSKKLQATWYAPPPLVPGGPPAYELLPRVFVSQLEVGKLSPAAQSIILRYTSCLSDFTPIAAWGAMLSGALPWSPPSADDYDALLAESEYAAWTLANGYALNHTALSVHRISPPIEGGLAAFNARLRGLGFELNGEGGEVKASSDALLLQSSTVADVDAAAELPSGSGGGGKALRRVARAYIEFVERRPLPQHAALPPERLAEVHRRDGFEAANADNIFASTTLAARGGGGGGGGGGA